jgi:hypothetical protein
VEVMGTDSSPCVVEYHLHQTPSIVPWRYSALYRDDRWWQIGFDGKELEMRYGQVGGATLSAKTEVTPNTSGRSVFEQAILNARKRYCDKWSEGYRPLGLGSALRSGMKGNEYKPGKTKLSFPLAVQLKLDGMRLLTFLNENGQVVMRSYENKPQNHLGHLHEEVIRFMQYLPPGSTIDSELYIHGVTFNTLMSIARATVNIHPRIGELELHIFDVDYMDPVNGPPTFDQRYVTLMEAFNSYKEDHGDPAGLKLVPVSTVTSHEQIESLMEESILSGYEGLMIKKVGFDSSGGRHPIESKGWRDSLYRYARCSNILKYKWSEDEELTITDVVEEVGTHKGCGKFVGYDPRGNPITVSGPGTLEERKVYLQNKGAYIGKRLTYKFRGLSEYGVPRFPTGKAIRDYE